jgi:UDP-3-O-[3-hydroxymyristoyl] glucosamine N-acyltransferase
MNLKAQEIANILGGTIEGDANVEVNSVAKIEDGCVGNLCFLANEKYTKYIYITSASVIIVNRSFILEKKIKNTLIRVDDAYSSFSQLIEIYNNIETDKTGISDKAEICTNKLIGDNVYIGPFTSISEGATIEKNVKIHSNCFIGENVIIKKNSVIFSGVSIYRDCVIGENNIIHSGAIIGADGFGFAPNKDNHYKKISQIGNVKTSNDVEIGANTTIDRATMGSTKIGKGVKLDNLIQIGHNVEIGEHTVIAAQSCVAGSSKIGNECMIGGQVAISGHLTIANKVKIAGQSGIASSIMKEGAIVQGPMAFNKKDFQRSYVIFKKLPELYKKLNSIKNQFDT